MILQFKNLFIYLFLFIPLFLITGPAIPDIVITLGILFGIFYILYQKEYDNFIKLNLFRISIIFWLSLILISFFIVSNSLAMEIKFEANSIELIDKDERIIAKKEINFISGLIFTKYESL